MDRPRYLAVKLLLRCEEAGYADLVLKGALAKEALSGQERQFVSALVYGTLERQRLLDALLDCFLKKPVRRLDAPVRAILRSGLYQCRFMDGVPVYAAVNAAVDLTRRFGKSSAAGMVNAVLRRAADAPLERLRFADETARLATLYSVSDSIAAMLRRAYPGREEEILRAFEAGTPTVLRANTLRTTAPALCQTLAQEGLTAECLPLPGAVLLAQGGDIAHTAAFAKGLFHVQGLASQLAALALDVRPGQTVLDLCAAPGGKSLTLAQQMQDRGQLICGELQPARLALIQQQMVRCGVTCARLRCADAAVYDPALPAADAVLCDVPCSGSGTLSRKPDIRYKDLDAIRPALVATQARILRTAARYVKDGGSLVYSTCSLDPAENEAVVAAFLQAEPHFRPAKLPPGLPLPAAHSLFGPCGVILLPSCEGNDGFFIAKLEKV